VKPPDDFVRIVACNEGWYGRCRVCRNRRARERYHSSPEVRAAEIARSSRNRTRRLAEARASAGWLPGGYVLGLRHARRAARLTQAELALLAKLAPDTVGRLERGDHPAGGPTVKALADALAISVSQLRVSATRPPH
jgi:DNA-binding XRE family transcriptional regulator